MAHQIAQKVAPSRADTFERAGAVRAALNDAGSLRAEAESLLEAIPESCADVLAWSPEGFTIASVSSVLADNSGRALRVHHASHVAPLARSKVERTWTWMSVEELLGLGVPRQWAVEWAEACGGMPHPRSGTVVELRR